MRGVEEEAMELNLPLVEEAAKRWRLRQGIREQNRSKLQAGRILEVESPDRVRKRLERLAMIATKEKAAHATAVPTASLLETMGFERVLGKPDFLGMDFLELAVAVARFVGRIHIRTGSGRTAGFGTGFMVSPRLLLTNNHVLGTEEEAAYSEVEFDYQQDRHGRLLPVVVFGLDPRAFFLTSEGLDFTLVAVHEQSLNGVPLTQYGWSRLIGAQGKALQGDALNIIQHPKGETKQIVLRSNHLVDLFDEFAHYVTDTEPGSSGSPVYSDQWEVVALHHSGVPKMENGQYIAKDGSIWRPGMDPDDLEWVANEGIRVSSLVEYITQQHLPPEQARLRDAMLALEPPPPLETAARAASNSRSRSDSINTGLGSVPDGPAAGAYTWTIPLHVSVRLGPPSVAVDQSVAAPAGARPVVDVQASRLGERPYPSLPRVTQPSAPVVQTLDLGTALHALEAGRARPYYDAQADAGARSQYYGNLSPDGLGAAQLYDRLSDLLKSTHTNTLSYKEARLRHLYPWVDLRPNNKLQSIYTGEEYEPETIIREDFTITEALMAEARRQLGIMPHLSEASLQTHLEVLEASAPYNAEHVVPQSWFGERSPMKADLHHLFTCEQVCNSFRGNTPYFEFADFGEAIRQGCGKREGNRFEPAKGHGPVARATLYFLLRYPGEINRQAKEYTEDRIAMLLHWHVMHEVTDYERHRNASIHAIQGNRNPLIDFPAWAERIDFTRGLG
jgi:endonuclease G, mitochondrial